MERERESGRSGETVSGASPRLSAADSVASPRAVRYNDVTAEIRLWMAVMGGCDEGVYATRVIHRKSTLMQASARSVSNFSIWTTLGGNVNLSWHHVNVTLPEDVKRNRPESKVILNDISGRIEAGNLMALMGASGAGKTTFLNLISGRSASMLDVQGKLAINGKEVKPRDIRKVAAYVQQQDVFLNNLTVYEHIYMQAMLRMDKKESVKDREAVIETVLTEMDLQKVRNTRIGHPVFGTRGISGGEAKRLSFASEVLTDPPLLFADEPTSGLDSFSAQSVVKTLVALADNGRTIICTIHQPPSEVFLMFHKLLLIAEGRTAYLGSIHGASEMFERLGYPCPENYNHADFYVHTLAIRPGKEEECQARVKHITDAYHEKEESEGLAQDPAPTSRKMSRLLKNMSRRNEQSWLFQLRLLLWRSFVTAIREFQVIFVQLLQTVVLGLMTGLVFLQINEGNSYLRVQNFGGAFTMILLSVSYTTVYPIVQVLPVESTVLIRDRDNRMYPTWLFYASKFIAELPMNIFFSILFSLITYFLVGLRPEFGAFFLYFSTVFATAIVCKGIAFFISALAFTDPMLGVSLVIPLVVPTMMFSGLFINPNKIPNFLVWMDAVSQFKYEWENFMVNEFQNRSLGSCEGAVTRCFETGDEVLDSLGLVSGTSRINRNMGILVALFISYTVAGLLVLMSRLRFLKR